MFAGVFLQMMGLDFGLSSLALNLLLSLPNSRKVEMEADKIGLQLMSMACFDPTKAPLLWYVWTVLLCKDSSSADESFN